jgi:23S rRNA U2552 (ribose-2'-O)-methylase RlmE/FtsJ
MTYYLLPKTSINIQKYIHIQYEDTAPDISLSFSLSKYLTNMKEKIHTYGSEWDHYKKYTNPYEFIHTVVPYKHKSISKYKPLSRSYFKMIEILNLLKININDDAAGAISSFHLAEGPGGFIEALLHTRNNKNDRYIGMTIINDNDSNVPGWKKSNNFLLKHKNVFIEKAADGTGNLLNIENFKYCYSKYANSMEIITADGGFDFSQDFNKQEINITNLLFSQIAYAIIMQKSGGTFILKIFDSFMQHTVDLLYLLSSFYQKVYIIKPNTSRHANSERYIVCKGFIFNNTSDYFFNLLLPPFMDIMNNPDNKYVHRFLNIDVSLFFSIKLHEYNAIFGQQQLENIYNTFSIINNKSKYEKYANNMKNNIVKCMHWCNKFNIETNNPSIFTD